MPTYTDCLIYYTNSLRSFSFCRDKSKTGSDKFFIRASNFNLRPSCLNASFIRNQASGLVLKQFLNLELFLFVFVVVVVAVAVVVAACTL